MNRTGGPEANEAGWRTIGRPGLHGRGRSRRSAEFDSRYGPHCWRIRHVVAGQVLDRAAAARFIEDAYELLLAKNPLGLAELCARGRDVYENAHSNQHSGLDYAVQERKTEHVYDIALRRVLQRLGRSFDGEELLCVAGRGCDMPLLNPGQAPFNKPELIAQPALLGWWLPDSVECFWRSSKILEVRRLPAAEVRG